jgi:hypothetical protein
VTVLRRSIYVEGFSHGANPVPAACVGAGLQMSFFIAPETPREMINHQ